MTTEEHNLFEKAEMLVKRDVLYCVSGLIHELANIGNDYIDDLSQVLSDEELDGTWNEVYEHLLVTDWLAEKLEEKGEKVVKDFLGLTIWGRQCTGQAISLDDVIQDIAKEYF